jgi:hypothetical protein
MTDPRTPQDDDVVEPTSAPLNDETPRGDADKKHSEAGQHRVVNDDEEGTYTDVDLDPDDVTPGSGTA